LRIGGVIQGKNAVRLFAAMRTMSLDQLTLAGGEGCDILERVLEDAKRW